MALGRLAASFLLELTNEYLEFGCCWDDVKQKECASYYRRTLKHPFLFAFFYNIQQIFAFLRGEKSIRAPSITRLYTTVATFDCLSVVLLLLLLFRQIGSSAQLSSRTRNSDLEAPAIARSVAAFTRLYSSHASPAPPDLVVLIRFGRWLPPISYSSSSPPPLPATWHGTNKKKRGGEGYRRNIR